MIEPGVCAAMCRRAELATAQERSVQRDVDDGAPRVRRHVLGGNGEVRGRVVDEHAGQAERSFGRVERGRDLVGVADVARDREDRRAERFDRVACPRRDVRACGSRSRSTRRPARTRPRSPCPDRYRAPVTKTVTPSNVPAGSARRADRGRRGQSDERRHSRFSSPCSSADGLRIARGAHLGDVVAAIDEGLVDHLVVHRAADLRAARGAGSLRAPSSR